MPIKKISLYVSITALFLIPLFPLIVANSFFFPFITGKGFYFRIIVEIGFAAWIILAFLDAKYRPRITPITIGVTLFALIALVADLLGVNPIRSLWSNFERMEGWIVIIHLWAFYIMASSVLHPMEPTDNGKPVDEVGTKLWHRWIITSTVVAFVIACYGLLQLSGALAIHQGSSRLDASLGNSAYLAVYMIISLFLAAYMYFSKNPFQKKHSWTGWLYAALVSPALIEIISYVAPRIHMSNSLAGILFIVVSLVAVYFWRYQAISVLFALIVLETQTRGTILGLVGGVMLALAIYAIFGKNEPSRRRKASGGIVIAILVLGGVFYAVRHQPWVETNPILGRFSNLSWNEASNQARQYIWPMAVSGALHRPLFGWGQENFNYIFNADYNPAMWSQEQWFDRAHSVFLDWLVAGGIVGLIAYLSLYFLFLMGVWRSSLSMAEKSVLTGLLAGYFIHNIFVFDNLASYALFFAALGLVNSFGDRKALAVAAISADSVAQKYPNWFGTKPVRIDAVEYIVAPIAIVLLVGVVYYFNVRPIQANTRLISALTSCSSQTPNADLFQSALNVNAYVANQETREQLISCGTNVITNQQIAGPTKQAFYELTTKEINAQIAATPKDARIYVLGGAFYDAIGQYDQAANLLEIGHKLSPGKQTLDFELATAYININKNPEALTLLKQAYDSAPEYPQAQTAYSVALVLNGKEAQARQMFKNDPTIFDTEQMASVFISRKEYAKALNIYLDLASSTPTNVTVQTRVAQLQFTLGMVSQSIATLRKIEKDHPELKDQIEAAIKQVQSK